MRLTKFEALDFRSHAKVGLDLAPVSVLLGPNNVGKSSVTQAILTLNRVARFRPIQMPSAGPFALPALTRNSGSKTITLGASFEPMAGDFGLQPVNYRIVLNENPDGTPTVSAEDLTVGALNFISRGNGRAVEGQLAAVMLADPLFPSSSVLACLFRNPPPSVPRDRSIDAASFCLRSIGQYRLVPQFVSNPGQLDLESAPNVSREGHGTTELLAYLSQTAPDAFGKVLEDLQRVIGGLHNLAFRPAIADPDQVEVVAEFDDDRSSVPAAQLSDGTRGLLGLLTLLHSPRRFRTVIFEEPESGLTPRGIEVFAETLMTLAASNDPPTQFIITTHSPFLIESLLYISHLASRGGLLDIEVLSRSEDSTLLEPFEVVKNRTLELGVGTRTLDSVDIADLLRRL